SPHWRRLRPLPTGGASVRTGRGMAVCRSVRMHTPMHSHPPGLRVIGGTGDTRRSGVVRLPAIRLFAVGDAGRPVFPGMPAPRPAVDGAGDVGNRLLGGPTR